jgi:elongation factor Ts
MIETAQVKELRDKTGVSIMQCKKALEEAGGNMEKAVIILQRKGSDIAQKKADRELKAGAIQSYIHATGNVGAIVELSCETDFVAKNESFTALAYDVAMHVAASDPQFLKMEDITEEAKKQAMEVFEKEIRGKPEEMKAKIMEGKLKSYFGEKVLLDQKFIKNPELTIHDLINSATQKFGERIEIRRFVRFSTSQ